MSNNNKQNLFAVSGLLFGALCWGIIWYPYRLMSEAGVSGVASSFYTYSIALVMGSCIFVRHWRVILKLPHRAWWLGLLAGWTNLSYVLAVIDGEVMRIMLLFYLSPLWTLLLAHFWLKERIHASGYMAIAISLLGAFIMLNDFSGNALPLPHNHAEWLALSSGIGFSLANVVTRRSADLNLATKSMLVWIGVVGVSLVMLPWVDAKFPSPDFFSISQWQTMLVIALLLMLATIFVQYGVTQMTAVRASVLFLFELVVAAIASYYLAHEAMAWNEWVGGSMIVAAGLISAMQRNA
ncbi:MAG TPA: EamA family transporter [Methylophilaceae bacterium]|nr:EamA family transporter [Methylophilaceae bacterium]